MGTIDVEHAHHHHVEPAATEKDPVCGMAVTPGKAKGGTASFGGHEYSRFGYPWMAEYVRSNPLGPNFLWCADIQEGVEELLYVDQVHYSPGMSDRLAGCIVDLLRARGFLS